MALRTVSEEIKDSALRCNVCKKPKKQSSGSLTQWVFEEGYCMCGREALATEAELLNQSSKSDVDFCSICGKKSVIGRAGSLTQWIFKQEACRCNKESANGGIAGTDGRSGFDTGGSISDDGEAGTATGSARSFTQLNIIRPGADRSPSRTAGNTMPNEPAVEDELPPLSEREFPSARYKPLRRLGKGASGAVYKCYDRQLKRLVAVKILNVLSHEEAIQFQNEARASAQLNRPGIIKILDFGITSGGHPYMVMEFLNGLSLNTYLKEVGVMTQDDTRYLALRIADALSNAHDHGIFHRDIKPANVMVESTIDGLLRDVTLIDFGVAMFRKGGDQSPEQNAGNPTLAGTPLYMSSDQAEGREYDARSEVYSVGCLLYEMLVGKPPFEADSALQLLNMHANMQPPLVSALRSDIPPNTGLEQVISRCLEKSPDNRFQSMDELAEAVDEIEPIQSTNEFARVEIEKKSERKSERSSSALRFYIIAAIAFTCFAALILFQLMRPKNIPKISSTFQRDVSYNNRTFQSVDSMVDFAENLHEVQSEQLPDQFVLEDGSLLLAGNCASDEFVQKLKWPDGYLKSVNINTGPLSARGLNVLLRNNSLRSINLLSLANLKNPDIAAVLNRNPDLDAVNLTNLDLTPSIIGSIGGHPKLRTIYLKYINLKGANLAPIAALPKLASLTLRYCQVGEREIDQIATMKRLAILDISGAHIDNASLLKLAQLKNLRIAYIAGCKGVTSSGVEALIAAVPPRCKVEYSIPYTTAQSLENLNDDADLKKLVYEGETVIDLSSWNISNDGIAHLIGKPINSLSVSNTHLTDKAFTLISQIQSLESLMITRMEGITDGALQEVVKLKNLIGLHMNSNKFSDQAIADVIDGLPKLKVFSANASPRLSTRTCQALSRKKLLSIRLENCNLHDADLVRLSKISGLKELSVSGNFHLTKRGLQVLERCQSLSSLQIGSPADEITRRYLKSRLPKCNIRFFQQ
ncbi:MAG: protein kinase [Candidatus Melainabacteria bacterium]|nr:protein kinase [Candidatus Melainabacteria bacterium]